MRTVKFQDSELQLDSVFKVIRTHYCKLLDHQKQLEVFRSQLPLIKMNGSLSKNSEITSHVNFSQQILNTSQQLEQFLLKSVVEQCF